MSTAIIVLVAFAASTLTFFSGFGLGTVLLPVFAAFYSLEVAIASTAIVHFLNGVFKLALVGRHADLRIVFRFGAPAIFAAIAGALLLLRMGNVPPLTSYTLLGATAEPHPAKIVVGLIMLLAVAVEMVPRLATATVPPRYLPLGGALSGLLGGLSGLQGALRTAFLVRLGLSREAFIATGVVVAVLVDVSRLGVYARGLLEQRASLDHATLVAAVLAAFAGAVLGNRLLARLTMGRVRRIVGVMLGIAAVALIAGVL